MSIVLYIFVTEKETKWWALTFVKCSSSSTDRPGLHPHGHMRAHARLDIGRRGETNYSTVVLKNLSVNVLLYAEMISNHKKEITDESISISKIHKMQILWKWTLKSEVIFSM